MKIDKETIWHFVCPKCMGWFSIASMDDWTPKIIYCAHCGEKIHDKKNEKKRI
jgi:rRNA maturation endonuclease Nob1